MFRKKTRGEVIGAELQEGFSHLGTAVTEASHAIAEELAPRVVAAREVAGPRIEAAQKAVVPRVAAAVAATAPVMAGARETLVPRVEAARVAVTPRVEAARAAAARAAADLAPRVDLARGAIERDVVPRLTVAQAAALAYAAPKVVAAQKAVIPVLENARDTVTAGVETAVAELEHVLQEFASSTTEAQKKATKRAKKLRKQQAKEAARTESRRWPWALAVLAVGAAAFAVLRRLQGPQDSWTPAPAGDGPVPTYREDPVPSSPSDSGKTVSSAQSSAGDATPPDTDLGMQTAQPAPGPEGAGRDDTPGAGSGSPSDPALDTATAAPGDQPQTAPDATGSGSETTDPTESGGASRA